MTTIEAAAKAIWDVDAHPGRPTWEDVLGNPDYEEAVNDCREYAIAALSAAPDEDGFMIIREVLEGRRFVWKALWYIPAKSPIVKEDFGGGHEGKLAAEKWLADYEAASPAHAKVDDAGMVATRRHWLPVGECKYCDDARNDSMMPYHDASKRCESGKHSHCTCDNCY